MAWKNQKPASGIPASGAAPSGSLGFGSKGKGTGKREPFQPGNTAGAAENRTGGTTYRRLKREERVAKLTEMAYDIAADGETHAVKLAAIRYLWDREEGAIAPPKVGGDGEGPIVVKGGLPDDD